MEAKHLTISYDFQKISHSGGKKWVKEGVLGGTQYSKEKLTNTEIPCQKSLKYRYRMYNWSRILKFVSISRVFLSQACVHQQSTQLYNNREAPSLAPQLFIVEKQSNNE